MTNMIQTTVEILGKAYPIRCTESELSSLHEAASLLNEQMTAIKESGKAINLERIAIITALNMAHQLLLGNRHRSITSTHMQERLKRLKLLLDDAVKKTWHGEPSTSE